MQTFEYTDTKDVVSDAVDEVYYNSTKRQLAVDLNDRVYVFDNVPEYYYRSFVNAPSVGGRLTDLKRTYGPSKYLGTYGEIHYAKVDETVVAPDMGPVVTNHGTVGTPKALVYANDAKASGGTFHPGGTYPLTVAAKNEGLVHTVVFDVNGQTKTHSLLAGSVDEAVETITDLSDALGVTFKVKQVVVNFE